MTRTPVRALRAGVVLFTGLLLAVASATGPTPAATALLVAVAATLLAVALGSQATVVARVRRLRIGRRDRRHEESLAEIAVPAHPDAAGHVRSRAPGSVVPTA